MKFSVGYQLCDDYWFVENIIKRKEHISEVYFSYGDMPNGRNNQLERADMSKEAALNKQLEDISILSGEGIKLNLLFNATCYGKNSLSREFFSKIGDTVDFIAEEYNLASVTTTSPVIAEFIKRNFDGIDVRASVNMGIGTIEGFEYVADCFDSFYLKRELNRDFEKIKLLKAWCDKNGKTLYGLANSGCLNNCSAHSFHDNLVSHESEISKMDNGFTFNGICHKYLKKEGNILKFLDNTGFIRPEDVHLYEGLFPSLKLATRVNINPVRVLASYIDFKTHKGNIMDILEPNHGSVIYPYIIENSLIEAEIENEKLIYKNTKNALIKMEEDIYVNR